MARPKARDADKPVQKELPEWERCIQVTVLEKRKWSPGVIAKCVACKSAQSNGDLKARCQTHDPKTKHKVVHTETPEAFDLFKLYRDAPEERQSINNVAEDHGYNLAKLRYMEQLSSWFNWPDRRRAKKLFEDEQDAKLEQRAKKTRKKRLRGRLEKIQEDLLDRSEKLIVQADQMASYPIVEQTIEKGGKVTIFKPAGWSRRDIPRFYEKAAQLAEFAGELEGPDRIIEGRTLGAATTAAPASASSGTAAAGAAESRTGIAEKVQTPQDLIDRVLVKIPSHLLYQAYLKRLDLEGRAEEEAQAAEDAERQKRDEELAEGAPLEGGG